MLSGGTTVSSTLFSSYKVGIKVFVTGGIGGVHFDGENSNFFSLIFLQYFDVN